MSTQATDFIEKNKADDAPKQRLYGKDLIRKDGLWHILKEDFKNYDQGLKPLLKPGFQTLAIYRFGTWTQLVRNSILRKLIRLPYFLAFIFARNIYGIELSDQIRIGRRMIIAHQSGIVIHVFGTFGDDCIIRQNVTLGIGIGIEHGIGPVIGDRVHFGPGAAVVGNITIGDDVIIGPNCVITNDVPSNRTLFVSPPRVFPLG